jgi:hypothetical protein
MSDTRDLPGRTVTEIPWWHDTPNQTPPTGDAGGSDGGDTWPTNEPRTQTINLSDSILDEVVPVIYGSCRVNGRIGFWNYTVSGRNLDLGIVLGYGEQDSVTSAACNLDTSPTGVTFGTAHTGDGSSGLSSYLTGATGWVAADTTHWQAYAHVAVRISCNSSQLPPTPAFSAICAGKLVTPIGGGTATATTNPAVIAYDILTAAEFGNMATADLDDDSFLAVADFCDDVMADSETRYAFTGPILERNPIRAANYVLKHCNGYLYAGQDGTIHCWAEKLPPLITGTWTYAAGTLTEDGSVGAATTELEVGQLIVHDGEVGEVTAITNDDTFDATFHTGTPDTASLPVRAGGTKHIEKDHWAGQPRITQQSANQIPDVVKARFPDTLEQGSHEITITYGSNTDKVSNLNYNVPEAAHALRAAKTKLLLGQTARFFWAGRLPYEVGAHLEPGDVIFLSDDVVTNQAVTVQHPISANSDGSFSVTCREFDVAAFEEGTETTDTIPATGTGWDPSRAPVTSQIQYSYIAALYDLIGEASGETYPGNSSKPTTLGGSYNALPNNVALEVRETGGTIRQAIKMDTSNRFVLGDGANPGYVDWSAMVLQQNSPLQSGTTTAWGSRVNLIQYQSSGDVILVGDNVTLTTISGNKIAFDTSGTTVIFRGKLAGTGAAPTTANLPNDMDFCIWEQTTGPTFTWFINDGGTIRQIS